MKQISVEGQLNSWQAKYVLAIVVLRHSYLSGMIRPCCIKATLGVVDLLIVEIQEICKTGIQWRLLIRYAILLNIRLSLRHLVLLSGPHCKIEIRFPDPYQLMRQFGGVGWCHNGIGH